MATLSSAMRFATRDPDAHDPDRPSSFDAMHTALVVKDPIHHADIATHPLYGAATPAVGHAWALPRSHPLWRPMDFEVPAETLTEARVRDEGHPAQQGREEREAGLPGG